MHVAPGEPTLTREVIDAAVCYHGLDILEPSCAAQVALQRAGQFVTADAIPAGAGSPC